MLMNDESLSYAVDSRGCHPDRRMWDLSRRDSRRFAPRNDSRAARHILS